MTVRVATTMSWLREDHSPEKVEQANTYLQEWVAAYQATEVQMFGDSWGDLAFFGVQGQTELDPDTVEFIDWSERYPIKEEEV